MELEMEIRRFKMDLIRKMPFYGDIVMRLPFVENKKIPTARTDGGKIEYNPAFLSEQSAGQRNFILMHEVFHVLLFHCKRNADRDPRLWNTAADMVVNSMLCSLESSMKKAGIPFERPKTGIFVSVGIDITVENIYQKLLVDNAKMSRRAKKVVLQRYRYGHGMEPFEVDIPDDIVFSDNETDGGNRGSSGGASERSGLSENALKQIIYESASANRSDFGSYFMPEQVYSLTESRRIKWQKLLREYFVEDLTDEASYTTPERKYIHMDLILPGYGQTEERIEEIWAFVDSSGSIGKDTMEQFLTQLYRISKEFSCTMNICYWDTEVTDVYKKILDKDDILKSLPQHYGGTDINCVYRWLKENKVRPDVMLILTDGYFGSLNNNSFIPSLRKKTILVLSKPVPANEDMKRIGKITSLV